MVNRLVRTKKSSDYQRLKTNGKKFSGSSFIFVNYQVIPESITKYGITISAKVGPAHLRNKLKRWCREYMRIHEKNRSHPRHLEINFIFKTVGNKFYDELNYVSFCKEMDGVFGRVRSLNKGIS